MSELSGKAGRRDRSTTKRRAVLASGLAVAVLAVGAGTTWAATTHGTDSGSIATRTGTAAAVIDAARHPARQIDVRGPEGLPKKPVALRVGDRIVVHLREQAGSTGYSWMARSVPKSLRAAGDKVHPGAGIPGAVEEHTFTFRATRAGSGTLTFSLRRPWESAPAATATLSVTVRN